MDSQVAGWMLFLGWIKYQQSYFFSAALMTFLIRAITPGMATSTLPEVFLAPDKLNWRLAKGLKDLIIDCGRR
jgi:hypothetical protein